MSVHAENILSKLNIAPENPGACTGIHGWADLSGALLTSSNPATGGTLAKIHTASERDYEAVVANAQVSFLAWREVPAPRRGDIIRQIANMLRNMKDELGSLIALEMGKSKQEGDGEVQEMIDIADFAVGQSRMLYGKTMPSERPQHRMCEQWHPYGVVGIVTAFNFPMAVWAWNAFIAAICGNAVVWKPSPKTPLCAIAIQHICNEVLNENNCPNIFSFFVPEDNHLTQRFLSDDRVPLMSFTGSCKVGQQVAETVAGRFGRCILELGGNNAVIIDDTADLSIALPAVVFGAVGTAGQRCTSTRRVFVQRTIYHDFVQKLVGAYGQLKVGDPLDASNHMGPLIDAHAVSQFESTVSTCKALGAEVLVGGDVVAGVGHYVQPTVIANVENHWDIIQKETFAPILYVMPFDELTDAITEHNAVNQGLSSALFTQNVQHAEQFLSYMGSDCGIANINIGTSGAEIGGAFGGEKHTGGGRESGSDAWKAYMRRQTNTINWGSELPLAQGITFNLT